MGQHYDQIGSDERNFIQRQLNLNRSQSWIAGGLGRPRSAIWREIRHNRGVLADYDAAAPARAGECAVPAARVSWMTGRM